jgi:hypothetical protein
MSKLLARSAAGSLWGAEASTTSKHIEMSSFCGPDARDPLGGSSQFKYYPYLLALSNPRNRWGGGTPPPAPPPWGAALRRGQIVLIAELQVKTKPPGLRSGGGGNWPPESPPIASGRVGLAAGAGFDRRCAGRFLPRRQPVL